MMREPPDRQRANRRALAAALIAVAAVLILVEPFPKGAVLLVLTEHHGIDAGDLPALVLILVAAWLALSRPLS
jgi:hypothetical protein